MKYNPRSRKLFTDEGHFLKRLHCPRRARWDEMNPADAPGSRICDHCDRRVMDTAELSDEDLRRLLAANPDTCLKIDPDQTNLTLTMAHDPR